ncbi:hypothetical protein JZ751_023199 [Albula glossodonta]|uniref:Uncharacterized protein n=1 Tax=Albula glossodonta TaxID=121402 RepID=A0A8T2PN39_9TELE|nr:hypothetical protein JZ751_023199 [Albula glossodonta]
MECDKRIVVTGKRSKATDLIGQEINSPEGRQPHKFFSLTRGTSCCHRHRVLLANFRGKSDTCGFPPESLQNGLSERSLAPGNVWDQWAGSARTTNPREPASPERARCTSPGAQRRGCCFRCA